MVKEAPAALEATLNAFSYCKFNGSNKFSYRVRVYILLAFDSASHHKITNHPKCTWFGLCVCMLVGTMYH